MQTETTPNNLRHKSAALQQLSTLAKRLHKAAKAESLSVALPVLRRLIATKVLNNLSLVALRNQQHMIQRKHILRMLAAEAGYSDWASYKHAVEAMPEKSKAHYAIALKGVGYPNLWFSSFDAANDYAAKHGGKPIAVGKQAVVVVKTT